MAQKLLIITGFGAFANVTDNPTQQIIRELQVSLPAITVTNETTGNSLSFEIVYYTLEVSVEFCESFITEIKSAYTDKELYFIHLGVDCNGQHIKLEQCAYNNKTFRVPDFRGYQPEQEAIESATEFNQPKQTSWDVTSVLATIHAKIANNHTANNYLLKPSFINISQDPGRYLCNYIYFRSLTLHEETRLASSTPFTRFSIFVHVPEFYTIEKDLQINIIKLIVETLLSKV